CAPGRRFPGPLEDKPGLRTALLNEPSRENLALATKRFLQLSDVDLLHGDVATRGLDSPETGCLPEQHERRLHSHRAEGHVGGGEANGYEQVGRHAGGWRERAVRDAVGGDGHRQVSLVEDRVFARVLRQRTPGALDLPDVDVVRAERDRVVRTPAGAYLLLAQNVRTDHPPCIAHV